MGAISLQLLQTLGSFIKRDRLPQLWASEIFNRTASFPLTLNQPTLRDDAGQG